MQRIVDQELPRGAALTTLNIRAKHKMEQRICSMFNVYVSAVIFLSNRAAARGKPFQHSVSFKNRQHIRDYIGRLSSIRASRDGLNVDVGELYARLADMDAANTQPASVGLPGPMFLDLEGAGFKWEDVEEVQSFAINTGKHEWSAAWFRDHCLRSILDALPQHLPPPSEKTLSDMVASVRYDANLRSSFVWDACATPLPQNANPDDFNAFAKKPTSSFLMLCTAFLECINWKEGKGPPTQTQFKKLFNYSNKSYGSSMCAQHKLTHRLASRVVLRWFEFHAPDEIANLRTIFNQGQEQ